MRRRVSIGAAWLLALTASGCAPTAPAPGPGGAVLAAPASPAAEGVKRVRSLVEMRRAGLFIQQWDLSCGAAALANVLRHHHGLMVDEREVALGMVCATPVDKIQDRGGFSLLDMKRYVVALGLAGMGYGGLTTDDLVALAPVIVPVHENDLPHYVVVRGRAGDRLLLADPAWGNRTMTAARFETIWSCGVGFVVAPADGRRLPPHPDPAPDFPAPTAAAVRTTVTRL